MKKPAIKNEANLHNQFNNMGGLQTDSHDASRGDGRGENHGGGRGENHSGTGGENYSGSDGENYDMGGAEKSKKFTDLMAGELMMIEKRYLGAVSKRQPWFDWWRECYKYTLPQYDNGTMDANRYSSIFDSTAVLAVEQLASNLVQDLLPSQTPWFDLVAVDKKIDNAAGDKGDKNKNAGGGAGDKGGAGDNGGASFNLDPSELKKITDDIAETLQEGDFYLAAHQAMLDLVVAGTGVLAVEKNHRGGVRFRAIPTTAILLEDSDGDNGAVFKESSLPLATIAAMAHATYTDQQSPNPNKNPNHDKEQRSMVEKYIKTIGGDDDDKVAVVEALLPTANNMVDYVLFVPQAGDNNKPLLLSYGRFRQMPLMVFRFMKAPGETYGRSPVMRALPDIVTANQVVELILKNASLNVAGIWLADDDGVININNLKLEPGAIIQKAVGSPGLTPLRTATLDLSQVVLSELRQNIQKALLTDSILSGDILASTRNAKTAAEVRQISESQTRILSASYRRLEHELLQPLVHRLLAVMVDEGRAPWSVLDRKRVRVEVSSPISRRRDMQEAGNMLSLLQTASAVGIDLIPHIDRDELIKKLFNYFQLTPTANTNGNGSGSGNENADAIANAILTPAKK